MQRFAGTSWLTAVAVLGTALLAGAAQAAVYVVDRSHAQANDANAGTEDQPWKTIQYAADTAQAGDTVCVVEGKYDERVKLKNSGAEGAPIIFQAMPLRRVDMQGFITGKASFIRIQGFCIQAPGQTGIEVGGDNIEILDNYLHDLGVGIQGHQLTTARPDKGPANIRIAYNEM